jgi:hypothetical protein
VPWTPAGPRLTWKPGKYKVSHNVYFGTDEDAVRSATKASPEFKGTRALGNEIYDPGKLEEIKELKEPKKEELDRPRR